MNTRPPIDFRVVAIAAILALMGAFFWAIRGTTGFGGSGGAMLAGLGWAVLWHLFSQLDGLGQHRPYGGLRVIAAITFGIALGGLTGYGAYIAWIQGKFYLEYPHDPREIGAWTGYVALFICGLHWGGNAGAFLAWCAPAKPITWQAWGARIGVGVAGAVLAALLVRAFPQCFLPFYREGIYQGTERAVGSVRNIAPHVGLFFGFLAYEVFRRDWRAVSVMIILGLGFALSFALGGYWHTFHGHPLGLDWWKHWEMTIGLGGGIALAVVFHWHNQPAATPIRPAPSNAERVWGAAIPIGLVTGGIVANTWQGVVNLHGLDWSGEYRVALTLLHLVAATAILLAWLRSGAPTLPRWIIGAILGLIVLAGYLVSVPGAYSLNLYALVAIYSVCVAGSLGLYFLVLRSPRQA